MKEYPGSSRYVKTRTLGVAPEVLRNNRIIMGLPDEPLGDLFRVLRTNILRQMRENAWNSLAITSAAPGAGKTFVAINLAIAIALEGNQSVLLVDGDFRHPAVAESLHLPVPSGLVDYLTSRADVPEVLVNPGFERLVIMPGRHTRIDSSELISSPRMASLVAELRTRYPDRIILFDIPPLSIADDALLFLPYIDGALLVAEDEKNTVAELREAMGILEQTNLLGVVLNKSRAPRARYSGHGYGRLLGNLDEDRS